MSAFYAKPATVRLAINALENAKIPPMWKQYGNSCGEPTHTVTGWKEHRKRLLAQCRAVLAVSESREAHHGN